MARGSGCNHARAGAPRGGGDFYTPELLRHVALEDGYQLAVWDAHKRDEDGKSILSYRFWHRQEPPLFEGLDFHCAPSEPVDSDATLRSILGFLTLRPGDTDADWFERYTPEQMAFAEGDAEMLQMYAVEDGLGFGDMDDHELVAPAPFVVPQVGETIKTGFWEGFEVINVYSREQGLEDGTIVEVSETAREAGYQVPVALTAALQALVTPTEAEAGDWGQDYQGRLWDVLNMGRGAARQAGREGEGRFRLYFQIKGRPEIHGGKRLMTLKVTQDATADGQLALTFSLPEES